MADKADDLVPAGFRRGSREENGFGPAFPWDMLGIGLGIEDDQWPFQGDSYMGRGCVNGDYQKGFIDERHKFTDGQQSGNRIGAGSQGPGDLKGQLFFFYGARD